MLPLHDAGAICGAPPVVMTMPPRGTPAPRNARIDLTLATAFRAGAPLALRTAPLPSAPRADVEHAARAWTAGAYEHVELAPLAPRTR